MNVARIGLLACALTFAPGGILHAQDLSYRIAAGAAIPSGRVAASRDLVPAAMLSVATWPNLYFGLRLG